MFGTIVGKKGYVGTTDGSGNDVVLVWLWESGTYTGWLGMITIDTGEYREFKDPDVTYPISSLLSTRNRFYTLRDVFVEFDPTKPGYSFAENIKPADRESPLWARSWTEDYKGRIWAACHPDATLVSFNPATNTITNHGSMFEHEAEIFPLTVAADDKGWVYVAISSQGVGVVGFNPENGNTLQLPDREFSFNSNRGIRVQPGPDGKVYADVRAQGGESYELYDGTAATLDEEPRLFADFSFREYTYQIDGNQVVTGYAQLAYGTLPSGRRVTEFNLKRVDPYLVVQDPGTGSSRRISFDPSGGATQPMGVTRAPDGTLVGGTYLPHQFFNYDPENGQWFRTPDLYGQLNAMDATAESVYFGVYPKGALDEWDPDARWDPPKESDSPHNHDRNPSWLATARTERTDRGNEVGRPYTVLAHPNGRHVIMGGNRGYGTAFGGLLIWNRERQESTVMTAEEVMPNHNTFSLAPLPNGNFLGGTSTEPAQGGTRKADVAALYEMNLDSKEIVWQEQPLEYVTSGRGYWDLVAHDGLVYGVTYPRGSNRFFVFDPGSREVIHETKLDRRPPHQQGPQVLHAAPDNRLFIVFEDGTVGEISPDTYAIETVAEPPAELESTTVRNGGVVNDGELYFCTDSDLISWTIA
jgi:hypothetical protein